MLDLFLATLERKNPSLTNYPVLIHKHNNSLCEVTPVLERLSCKCLWTLSILQLSKPRITFVTKLRLKSGVMQKKCVRRS